MATHRGFVQQIEVGRAGLVRVAVQHTNGSVGNYVIHDLDGDPERFNERLSKLGILRDAQNRAEPVFIEHSSSEQGEEIHVVARISRDDLSPTTNVQSFGGFVLDVMVHARNNAVGASEEPDRADVALLLTDFSQRSATLNLQAPERAVTQAQLQMLLDAEAQGRLVRVIVRSDSPTNSAGFGIVSVAIDNEFDGSVDGREPPAEVDGFVESLSLIPITPGGGSLASNMAHVRFTTAPEFSGPGNTVSLVAFTPITLDLLVFKGSSSYALFEAGLRDNLRMRVAVMMFDQHEPGDDSSIDTRDGASVGFMHSAAARAASTDGGPDNLGMAFGAALLAPLASASRGVWIKIWRGSLDKGIEGEACTDGVPSSDLAPQSLRDLRLPYPASWRGLGCFNGGVYRFQFDIATEFSVSVDDETLCLHDSDDGSERFAHACLGGEHEIIVTMPQWMCDYTFNMDIYRLR